MTAKRKGEEPTAARSTRVARESGPRRLTDPRAMRALAHPIRMQLIELLTREGPLTATEAAELTGESPANCSFHLRTLAKYGFVEEAEGGTGRSRPWRRSALGVSIDMVADDAATRVAAREMSAMHMDRQFEYLRQWLADAPGYTDTWQAAAFSDTMLCYLTADEMRVIEEEIFEIMNRYRDRTLDRAERPEGALPVSLNAFAHPLRPLPSGN